MDAKTLEALKGSIAKWEAIVAGTGEDNGAYNCPLCAMFMVEGVELCRGCPVRERTRHPGCGETPYDAFCRAIPGSAQEAAAAQAELDFLRSLLPPAEEA